MTVRDLIIYNLKNNLENEDIFLDGKIVGFLKIEEAAEKFNVGIPTIMTWIALGRINAIRIGNCYYIDPTSEVEQT